MNESAGEKASEAERQVVKSYLGKNPNNWLWEHMVRDLLSCHDRQTQKAIGKKLRQSATWKSKYRLSQFSDADIDDLARFIRAEAATVPASLSSEIPPAREADYTPELLNLMHSQNSIEKVALVSHNYKETVDSDIRDYSAHARKIIQVCDQHGCDTILFALYTWSVRSTVPRTSDALFDGLKHVQRIVMEVGDIAGCLGFEDLAVETWLRGSPSPVIHRQRFATFQQVEGSAHRFLDELEGRRMGKALLMICGETGIASVVRGSNELADPYSFNDRLNQMGVRVILNPIHDYMTRPEMKRKRRYYSQDGRTILSVWNKGKRKGESHLPWTVFHDGRERTELVREISSPVPNRPDIRIGIISLEECGE